MKNTYTIEELKVWFEAMEKKYRNSGAYQQLKGIELMMFDNWRGEGNTLEEFFKER